MLVARNGANLGDHGVLPVIVHAHSGVAGGSAFGMDDESGPDTACCGGVSARRGWCGQSNLGGLAVGGDAEHGACCAGAELPCDVRIDARVEGGREIAVAHHVAECGDSILPGVDQRAAEAAALRNVDGVDRRRRSGVPGAEVFEELAAAVRQRQGTRIAGPGRMRAAVEQQHALRPRRQRQGQRHADRPGADDGDVDAALIAGAGGAVGTSAAHSWRITSSISATVRGALV
jgi:hypothetical protein